MSVIIGIVRCLNGFQVETCDTQGEAWQQYRDDRSICEILDNLVADFEGSIGIIVVGDDYCLKSGHFERFKRADFKKYGNLVYLATTEELEYEYCLTLDSIFGWRLGSQIELWMGYCLSMYRSR